MKNKNLFTIAINGSLMHFEILKDRIEVLGLLRNKYLTSERAVKIIKNLQNKGKIKEVYLNIINSIG